VRGILSPSPYLSRQGRGKMKRGLFLIFLSPLAGEPTLLSPSGGEIE
jgi:hypothetical protein